MRHLGDPSFLHSSSGFPRSLPFPHGSFKTTQHPCAHLDRHPALVLLLPGFSLRRCSPNPQTVHPAASLLSDFSLRTP